MMFKTRKRRHLVRKGIRAILFSAVIFGLWYAVQYLAYNNIVLLIALLFVAIFTYVLFFPRGAF